MEAYLCFILMLIPLTLTCNKPSQENITTKKTTRPDTTTAKIVVTTDEAKIDPTVMNGCAGTRSSIVFTEKGNACIFPFYDGKTEYNSCFDWKGKYMWCATSLKTDCKYLKWGRCLPQATTKARPVDITTTKDVTEATTQGDSGNEAGESTDAGDGKGDGPDDVDGTTDEVGPPNGSEIDNGGGTEEGGIGALVSGLLAGAVGAGNGEEEEEVKVCTLEEEITECLNNRKKRSAECSSEPSTKCSSEGGYCGNPANCPGSNVVDNKCPGGNDNKCCLSIPYQADQCQEQGGQCADRCACEGEILHGFCPNQPDSIKCCKTSETASSVQACLPLETPALNCPGGTTSNCYNGNCTVTCSGGGAGGVGVGGGEGGEAEEFGGIGENAENGEEGGGGLSCPGGYNTNCNNGKCTISCSGGNGGTNNNNNGRKKRSTCQISECSNHKTSASCTAPLCQWTPGDRGGGVCSNNPCAECDKWYNNEKKELNKPGNWLDEVNRMFKCPCNITSCNTPECSQNKNSASCKDPCQWKIHPRLGGKCKCLSDFILPTDPTAEWVDDRACPLTDSNIVAVDNCADYHPGAVGCIRSNKKTPQGAGQQCCYDQSGEIIDPDGPEGAGAGTPDKVWAAGNFGEVLLGLISGQHKQVDVVPYNWCCKECKNGNDAARCKKYYQGARKLDISHC